MSSTLHLEGQARYFTVLDIHKIKLDKNKMDSRFIKSHQRSLLERSHAVFWLKLILNSDQDLLEKTDSYRSTSHKNLQKQNNEDFFIQLFCLATSHQ